MRQKDGRKGWEDLSCLNISVYWVVKMLHVNLLHVFFFSKLLQRQNERHILIPLFFHGGVIFLIPFFGYFQTPEESRSSLRATSVLKVPSTPQPWLTTAS